MATKRITDLPLDQLIAIATGEVSAPSCYNCSGKNSECEKGAISAERAAEDIGIIFANTKDTVAGKTLAEIMPINFTMAFIGYAHLSRKRNELTPETKELLKAYEENPQNAEDLKRIKDRIIKSVTGC